MQDIKFLRNNIEGPTKELKNQGSTKYFCTKQVCLKLLNNVRNDVHLLKNGR